VNSGPLFKGQHIQKKIHRVSHSELIFCDLRHILRVIKGKNIV